MSWIKPPEPPENTYRGGANSYSVYNTQGWKEAGSGHGLPPVLVQVCGGGFLLPLLYTGLQYRTSLPSVPLLKKCSFPPARMCYDPCQENSAHSSGLHDSGVTLLKQLLLY